MGPNILVAAEVEKCEVLQIVTSDLYVVFREHSLGTRATFPPNGVTSVTLGDQEVLTDKFCHAGHILTF